MKDSILMFLIAPLVYLQRKIFMSQGPWGKDSPSSDDPEFKGKKQKDPWSSQAESVKDVIEELKKRFDEFGKKGPPFFKKSKKSSPTGPGPRKILLGGALVLVLLWLAQGFYRVQPDQKGVVLRFGQWVRTDLPGLNYHLPYPIETVLLPSVTRVKRVDIGFRPSAGETRQIPEESLMLTGDENIVDINFTVFWLIRDPGAFLFNIRSPEATVKAAAESAMREVISHTPIAQALAEGRKVIEDDVRDLLQKHLNQYGSGIEVTEVQLQRVDPPSEVIESYRDVQRARTDFSRLKNDSEAYRNKIIPEARGDAERIIQEAEGYKQSVVAQAEGQASRFDSILRGYTSAPVVTQKRLYIEAVESVLKNTKKVILDKSGSGVLPYLPLEGLAPKAGGEETVQAEEGGVL